VINLDRSLRMMASAQAVATGSGALAKPLATSRTAKKSARSAAATR
jgi:hypothetical protein